MKLLFDQNLSPYLVGRLADAFPDSSHVSLLGLDRAGDSQVWEYARDNEFAIVTKDADFGELGVLRGFPPWVVWLRIGNCTTREVEELLRTNRTTIQRLEQESTIGIISIYRNSISST